MNATILLNDTPLMYSQSKDSDVMTTLKQGDVVAVIEKPSKLWWKVAHNEFTGYVKTKFLKSEDENDLIDIMICVPRDCAMTLYKALEFSLKR